MFIAVVSVLLKLVKTEDLNAQRFGFLISLNCEHIAIGLLMEKFSLRLLDCHINGLEKESKAESYSF